MRIMKKELFNIQSLAYDNFMETKTDEEKQDLFLTGDTATFYKVSDSKKTEIHNFDYETQINSNALNNLGFEEDANINKLFEVNRKTKQFITFGNYNLL